MPRANSILSARKQNRKHCPSSSARRDWAQVEALSFQKGASLLLGFSGLDPSRGSISGPLTAQGAFLPTLAVVRSTFPKLRSLPRTLEILEMTLPRTWTHLQVWTKSGRGRREQGVRAPLPRAVPSPHPPGHAGPKVRRLPQRLPGRTRRARGAVGHGASRGPAPSSRLSRLGLASAARAPEPRPACCSSRRPAKERRRKGGGDTWRFYTS